MPGARIFLLVATVLLAASNGHAAEVERVDRPACKYLLEGDIVRGDLARLRALDLKGGDSLCLDSPGGSFLEGLDIADALMGRDVTTVLDKGASCLSACALIFMSGSDLGGEETYFGRRRMHITAKLGFHAPYATPGVSAYSPADIKAAYALGLLSVARMMTLGQHTSGEGEGFIPIRVILELLKKGPDEAYMIDTAIKAHELNIDLFGIPKAQWSSRTACNACVIWNLGHSVTDVCQTAEEVQAKKVSDRAIEFVFRGFAGEGSFLCAVRFTKMKDASIKGEIQPAIVDDGFPLKDINFFDLKDQDALDPEKRF